MSLILFIFVGCEPLSANKRYLKEKNVPFHIDLSSKRHHFLEFMVNFHLKLMLQLLADPPKWFY